MEFDLVGNLNVPDHPLKRRPDVQKKARELSQISSVKSLSFLFLDWIIISSTICLSELILNSWIYALSILIIASRQHGFLAFMHEGAHYRLLKNHALNDFIGDWFASFPILADTDGYRRHHQQHHRHLNTDKDPDWKRKTAEARWQFPKSQNNIIKDILYYIPTGFSEWAQLCIHFFKIRLQSSTSYPAHRWSKLLFLITVTAFTIYFNAETLVLKYWLLPLFFVFPSIQRIRSIAEHFGLQRTHELNSTRNVLSSELESFFFGPHKLNYHLTHHMFPSIPFFNLKKMNDFLKTIPEFRDHAHENDTYILAGEKSLWRDLKHKNNEFIYKKTA